MLHVEGTGIVKSLKTHAPHREGGSQVNALFIESVRPNRDGDLITNNLPVVAFGDLPDGVTEDAHIRVEGFLNRRSYKSGDDRSTWVTEVVATEVEVVDAAAELRPLLVSGQVEVTKLTSHAAKDDATVYNDLFVKTDRPNKDGELRPMSLPLSAFGDDIGVTEGDTVEITGAVSRFERRLPGGASRWETDVIVHNFDVMRDRTTETALEATGLER